MSVHWAAGMIRWKPHVSRTGDKHPLSHLHPFRFELHFPTNGNLPPRTVMVHVGFSCHVFTCRVEHAGPDPELYSDDLETRASMRSDTRDHTSCRGLSEVSSRGSAISQVATTS
jgi:hypothetical protein